MYFENVCYDSRQRKGLVAGGAFETPLHELLPNKLLILNYLLMFKLITNDGTNDK